MQLPETGSTPQQIESALRQSESNLRAIINASPEATFLIDEHGLVLVANEQTAQRLGVSLNEVIGRCIYNLLPPNMARTRRKHINHVFQTGQPFLFEDVRDGRVIEHHLHPVTDEQGRVRRVAVTGIDITARKQNEAALQQQQELLEAIRQAQALFIARQNRPQVFSELLKILVTTTNSEYGFLDEVLYDDGQPYKLSLALSDISWDAASYRLYQQLVARNLEFRNLNNLSGAPAVTGEVIIANDAPHDLRAGGLPPGHPPLRSFMGIPLVANGELVGVAGVANRPGGYTIAEANRIEALTSACANMIWALRLEQKEQEAVTALHASEDKWRSLVQTAPVTITIVNRDGIIEFINRASADRSVEQVIGQNVYQYLTANTQALTRQYVQSVLETDQPVMFENQVIRTNGDIIWYENLLAPLYHQNQITQVMLISTDITARKQMETAIQVNLEKYRVLVESFPLGITISDKDGRVVEANRQSEYLLGLSTDEHRQRHIAGQEWQLVRPDGSPMPPAEFASVRAMAENRLIENVEIGVVKAPGQVIWLNVTAAPIPLPDYGVVVTYNDITQRKQNEAVLAARLRLSEFATTHTLDELLRQTLDEAELITGSQIGFFHFVEADQKTLSLQIWSTNTLTAMCTAASNGLHYPVDEAGVWADCVVTRQPVIHNDYASLPHRKELPPGHVPVGRELIIPVLRGQQVVAILGVGNKPTDYQPQDVEAISLLANIAWDIVMRQRAEAGLRASLQEKEILLREIHHRVKNNLQFVSSLLSLQANMLPDPKMRAPFEDSQRRLRGMALVHEQLYRSTNLGQIHFKVYIQDLVTQVKDSMALAARPVAINLELDDVILPVDVAIPCGLIINELVSNALKYAFPPDDDRPGLVRLCLRLEPDNRLVLVISDNGVGLPPAISPAHNTTTLGLQLVDMLTRQLKGHLELDRHGGTTFTLTFPFP